MTGSSDLTLVVERIGDQQRPLRPSGDANRMLEAYLIALAVNVAEGKQVTAGDGRHLAGGHPPHRRDLTVGNV